MADGRDEKCSGSCSPPCAECRKRFREFTGSLGLAVQSLEGTLNGLNAVDEAEAVIRGLAGEA